MKAVVAAFNQEKALVGAFSVITNLRMELFEALLAVTDLVCVIIVTMDQVSIPFCGGRVDEEDEAVAAEAWKRLEPRIT